MIDIEGKCNDSLTHTSVLWFALWLFALGSFSDTALGKRLVETPATKHSLTHVV